MKSFIQAASVAVVCCCLGACATVTRGTHTQFAVESEPAGAAVKTSTGFSCASTPCSFKMSRKESFDVTITKDGFKPQTVHVASKVSGGGGAGFVGNAVAGGALGMVIDAADGSMNNLYPNPVHVKLDPETQASADGTQVASTASH